MAAKGLGLGRRGVERVNVRNLVALGQTAGSRLAKENWLRAQWAAPVCFCIQDAVLIVTIVSSFYCHLTILLRRAENYVWI